MPHNNRDDARIPREIEIMHRLRDCPELLEEIRTHQGAELALQKKLRENHAGELVAAGIQLEELRQKAINKFSRAGEMWFDRTGLEQATSESVASYKSQRFSGEILDLCCGIGGDSIALSDRGNVTVIDSNPAACLRAEWNAEVYGRELKTICGDVTKIPIGDRLVHIDPDRRPGSGGRVVRLEDAVPGLPFLKSVMETARGGAIKVSPAANFIGKFFDAEIELVSLRGECKEATLWFGELASAGVYRATALPSGETVAGNPLDAWTDVGELDHYLFDPDPALVRSGLIDLYASCSSVKRLDEEEEYLTGPELVESSFVSAFEVIESLPYHEKTLRRYFRDADFGQLEIKCRHIKVPIENLRRKLSLEGDRPGVLIVARIAGESRAIVSRRV